MPDSNSWRLVNGGREQDDSPTEEELQAWSGQPLTKNVGARVIAEVRRLRSELERTREELAEAQHYLGLARTVLGEQVQKKGERS